MEMNWLMGGIFCGVRMMKVKEFLAPKAHTKYG